MALTAIQITGAIATLKAILDGLKDDGIRGTVSPVLFGPLSKGEFQIFYGGSSWTPPGNEGNNSLFQQRTITFECRLLLKDLNDPNAAWPLLEECRDVLTGVQLFGGNIYDFYDGGLYPVSESFSQLQAENSFWFYQLSLSCQVTDDLAEPYQSGG